ncbi:MAG: HEPN domain-containing protein [Planctomycetes bacterium]|nr:HEPN domain-containing protein [Planctomycetota bacterium]
MTQYAEEIADLWQRASGTLRAAEDLLGKGHDDSVANRAYYAVFYAVSALFLSHGKSFSKHTGVRAHLHQAYVKPGRLPPEVGEIYNWLFALRDVGDYGVTKHVGPADARQAVLDARCLLQAVRPLLPPDVPEQA